MRKRYVLLVVGFVALAATLSGKKPYDETLTKDLVAAVLNKNVESTKSLLARNADPNAVDEKGTPLLMAMLLRREFSLNEAASGTISGDRSASETEQIVRLLLDAGADPNAKNAEGNPVLAAAFTRLDPGIVVDLIRAGASVKAAGSSGSLFVEAASFGNQRIVELMLDAGADVNAKTKDGTTALLVATYKQKWDLSRFLIQRGADVNARLDVGSSLLFAAAAGDLATVKLLVEKGADINAKDSRGISPLSAAQKRNHQEVVDFLKAAEGAPKASLGVIAITPFEVSVVKGVSLPGRQVPQENSPFLGAVSYTHYNMAVVLQVTNTAPGVARLNDEKLEVQVVDDTNARHNALGCTPTEIGQAGTVEGRMQSSADIDKQTMKLFYTLPNGTKVNAEIVLDKDGRARWTLELPAGKPTIVSCIFDIPTGRKAVQVALAGVEKLMPLPATPAAAR